jgi:hypothetical protein
MGNMETTIQKATAGPDGTNPVEEARMKAAFGKNWRDHTESIKETMGKMKGTTLRVNDANPETFDREWTEKQKAIAQKKWDAATPEERTAQGLKDPSTFQNMRAHADYNGSSGKDYVRLGSKWHHQADDLYKATTLIHETSHKVSKTGDHVVKDSKVIVDTTTASGLEAQHEIDKEVAAAAQASKQKSEEKKNEQKLEAKKAKDTAREAKAAASSSGKKKQNQPEASSSRRKPKQAETSASASGSAPQEVLEQEEQVHNDGPVQRGGGCKSRFSSYNLHRITLIC